MSHAVINLTAGHVQSLSCYFGLASLFWLCRIGSMIKQEFPSSYFSHSNDFYTTLQFSSHSVPDSNELVLHRLAISLLYFGLPMCDYQLFQYNGWIMRLFAALWFNLTSYLRFPFHSSEASRSSIQINYHFCRYSANSRISMLGPAELLMVFCCDIRQQKSLIVGHVPFY